MALRRNIGITARIAPGGFAFARSVVAAAVLAGFCFAGSSIATAGSLGRPLLASPGSSPPSIVTTAPIRGVSGGSLLDKPTFGEKFSRQRKPAKPVLR